MNCDLKGNIVKVKRGSFTDSKSGELRAYCIFYALVQGPTSDNEVGYDYEKFSCKVDNYKTLVDLVKNNKIVTISCEMVKQLNDTYKRRAINIDDIKL